MEFTESIDNSVFVENLGIAGFIEMLWGQGICWLGASVAIFGVFVLL
jgi:hypothetical protein